MPIYCGPVKILLSGVSPFTTERCTSRAEQERLVVRRRLGALSGLSWIEPDVLCRWVLVFLIQSDRDVLKKKLHSRRCCKTSYATDNNFYKWGNNGVAS